MVLTLGENKKKIVTLSSNTVKIENFDASKIYDFRTLRVWDPKNHWFLRDILVEFEEPVSLLKLVGFENFLKEITGIKVDVVPENDIRPELRENILNEVNYI